MNQPAKLSPTARQQEVLDQIQEFLESDSHVFILHGYAGTGKTTMIKWICELLNHESSYDVNTTSDANHKPYSVLTPTGRAAKVLRSKDIDAHTIHSAIYKRELLCLETENADVSKKKHEYIFPLKEISEYTRALIIDESSMVGDTVVHTEFLKFGSGRLLTDLLIFRSVALNNSLDKKLFIDSKENAEHMNHAIKQYYAAHSGHRSCKIIFVGDDAQLPPVGDSFSKALDAAYLRGLGLKVEEAFLTEVLRQEGKSGILSSSIAVRQLLDTDAAQRSSLRIEENGSDIFEISASEVVDHYVEKHPQPEIGAGIVVCYTNKLCYHYNMAIREKYYPSLVNKNGTDALFGNTIELQVGDILLNNKNTQVANDERVYNGDMGVVTAVGKRITQSSIPVTIDKEKRHIDLHYREVKVLFPDYGGEHSVYIIENLLYSDMRELTTWELRAQYINFCMRISNSHPHVKEGTEEFKGLLESDPFMNALHMKFGYAITCHKAQGGEWKDVTVDYTGRCGLSNDHLRWCYTATTRAQQRLFAVNPPKINGLTKLTFSAISQITKAPQNFLPPHSEIPDASTPFHPADALQGTKLKYMGIAEGVKDSGFKIEKVERYNYQDAYTFSQNGTPLPVVRMSYNKEGVFKPVSAMGIPSELADIINHAQFLPKLSGYTPSNETLAMLFQLMETACEEADVTITNVVEQLSNYYVLYNLKTDAQFACIQFYIKGNHLTTAMPKSQMGAEDDKLKQVIDIIKQSFHN
ncbi:MAG: AAA family ATPase [Bacteroidales bacterium]|nr:AAA family ATPase [Bacteroidales bacterium]